MAYSKVRELTGQASASSPLSVVATVPAAGCALGNLVVVGVSFDGAPGVTVALTDTGGNTWTQLGSDALNNGGSRFSRTRIYYSRLTTALVSGNVITATMSGGGACCEIVATEFTGNSASTIATAATPGTGSSTSPASASLTTTISDALLVAAIGYRKTNSVSTITAGSGWTGETQVGAGIGAPGHYDAVRLEYRIESATGTFTGNGTLSLSAEWGVVMGSFTEPAGGGGGGGNTNMFQSW